MNIVSAEQITALIDFMEAHPELALGRFHRTTEGRSLAKRLWAECANTVNSASSDSPSKTADGWRSYFSEYKSKVLKKVKTFKAQRSATGGGLHVQLVLTPLQERLYNILGRDVGEPLEGVRHNPLATTEDAYDDGDGAFVVVHESVSPIMFSMDAVARSPLPEPAEPTATIISQYEIHAGTPVASDTAAVHNTYSTRTPAHAQTSSEPPRQRRRRRRRLHESPRPSINGENSALEVAQSQLGQIESANAAAITKLSLSIDRMAAALELIAENLRPVFHQRDNNMEE